MTCPDHGASPCARPPFSHIGRTKHSTIFNPFLPLKGGDHENFKIKACGYWERCHRPYIYRLMIAGQPGRTAKAGEAFVIPAGVVHNARNSGNIVTKLIGVYIVEKD